MYQVYCYKDCLVKQYALNENITDEMDTDVPVLGYSLSREKQQRKHGYFSLVQFMNKEQTLIGRDMAHL